MGIFLGASLLSLIELVECFILLLKSENKLTTPKTSPKHKDMALLGTEKGATECIPVQQKTGNDSKRVGGGGDLYRPEETINEKMGSGGFETVYEENVKNIQEKNNNEAL
jgi:hypothetical protein